MDFYTIEEVSYLAKKSQKTIRRHIAAGYLKASKEQNKYRIYIDDYNNWKVKMNNDDYSFSNNNSTLIKNTSYKDEVNWIDISKSWHIDGWNNPKDRKPYNFIDLFSGAGGLSCGLVMAGFNPVATVEIMPQAVETYKYNFNDVKGFNESLESRDITSNEVKNSLYKKTKHLHIDLICGGFPCQGFSMSGNRIVTDKRNSLYLEMLDIVDHIKPDYVLCENVEGLRSMLNGKIEKKIIDDFNKIGYEMNVTVLNSADYGVAQKRKRVIFIGNRLHRKNFHPEPLYKESSYKTLGQELKRFLKEPNNPSINHTITNHSKSMQQRILKCPEGKSLYSDYSDAWKKSPWNKPSCTVKENHGGVNLHPKLPRVLTPRELAALQSFPDDFIFKGSKKWQLVQIGNAVPPLLGKAIGLAIARSLSENSLKQAV